MLVLKGVVILNNFIWRLIIAIIAVTFFVSECSFRERIIVPETSRLALVIR